jgi:hypothetical protein
VPTEDDFAPEEPLPLFLSGHADQKERRGSLLLLNAGILVMTTTLVGIAFALSWGNPAKVFAEATVSRTDFSARWPGTEIQSAPKIQLTRDIKGSAAAATPTVTGAQDHGEIAAASEPANQSQAENNGPSSEELFKQFQAWSAEQDARVDDARAEVEPAQGAPAPVTENAPAPVPKHRKRYVQKPRARVAQQQQNGQGQPVQDARAQQQPAQSTQPPSFLQSLGLHQ